jgi:protein-tyrosine phosphatase
MAGMSRSASVVIGYLISTGMTYEEAFFKVKMRHPQTCPNEGFREQLQKYATTFK